MMNLDGRFVWHELWTTDTAAAADFYHQLLGWTYYDHTMDDGQVYKMPTVAGKQFGGLVTLPDGASSVAHWIGYVAVADVDATAARAVDLGATLLMPPADIPNVGRFAKIADPAGAALFLFKSAGPEMEEPPPPPVAGMFCWDELQVAAPAASGEFYTALFGWSCTPGDLADRGYMLFKLNGEDVAGAMPAILESNAMNAWMHYILVDDLDGTASRIESRGGQIIMAPATIEGVGCFFVASDPTGAVIAFFAPAAR
jgi:predicted enzyme related to lactoylglutathione lyase